MLCVPTVSDEVAKLAWPEPLSDAVPRMLAPSLKVTVPVGVPTPRATAATVAVNVTDCPETEGFADVITAVMLTAFLNWIVFVPGCTSDRGTGTAMVLAPQAMFPFCVKQAGNGQG